MYELCDLITSENQWLAAKKTLKQKHCLKKEYNVFKSELLFNMDIIKDEITSKTYEHRGYNRFIVDEGKKRVIDAPSIRDKYVHHLINNLYLKYFKKLFIEDSYACIPERGNYYAVLKIQEYLNKSLKEPETWIVSIDISKFFSSVDLNILYFEILPKYIKDPDILYILKVIIFSYTKGGLPLGNLTSQLLANVYLNDLDWYIKRTLNIKHYVRYADDLTIFVNSKDQAQFVFDKIDYFVRNKLNMRLHPRKSSVIRFKEEYKSLGFLYTRKGVRIASDKYNSIQKRFAQDDRFGKISNGTKSAFSHIKIAINFKNIDSLEHLIIGNRLLVIPRGTLFRDKLINNFTSEGTHQVLARTNENIYIWVENRTINRCKYIDELEKGNYWFDYNYKHLIILLGGEKLANAWILTNPKYKDKIKLVPKDIIDFI